jgi:hypothetical protein
LLNQPLFSQEHEAVDRHRRFIGEQLHAESSPFSVFKVARYCLAGSISIGGQYVTWRSSRRSSCSDRFQAGRVARAVILAAVHQHKRRAWDMPISSGVLLRGHHLLDDGRVLQILR